MLKLDHTTGEMLEISLFDLLDGGVNGVSAALFEADGNAWKTQAIQNIREWLNKAIPDEMKDDVIILS